MQPVTSLIRFALLTSLLCLLAPRLCWAGVTYHVSLDTSALIGHAAGPFSVAFQLTDGSGQNDANNNVTLTHFQFGSGHANGSPTLVGNVNGDTLTSITLTDNAFLNAFIQPFSPGEKMEFDCSLTTNTDSDGTPDHFSFSILDRTGKPIPTKGGLNFDVLVSIDLDSSTPSVESFDSDQTVIPEGGGKPIDIHPVLALNSPPIAKSKDVTKASDSSCMANVSPIDLDNGSFDPDKGDTIVLTQTPTGPYPLGKTIVTLTATDSHGITSSSSSVVTVLDQTPPAVTNVSANPWTLWPPNHQMVDVAVNYDATDNCSPVSCTLSVTSNQPINSLGDGNTAPDWEILDAHHLRLRAERSGAESRRLYTITITCADEAGNSVVKTIAVSVPHDR